MIHPNLLDVVVIDDDDDDDDDSSCDSRIIRIPIMIVKINFNNFVFFMQ
jgi:hypothetical protein